MKKIVAINCSPRTTWNTASLVRAAGEGAKEEGAEVVHFDLYRLEKFTGCISCFGCKREPNRGKCICRDGLAPVLDAIRSADGLIIGTPNYFGDVTAAFRSLYERLAFQDLPYRKDSFSYSTRRIPVLLVMTSNCPEEFYDRAGYDRMLKGYQNILGAHVGNTRIMVYGDTLQVKDYDRYDWTMFDPKAKQKRHEEVFESEKLKARELGREIVKEGW
ncbi:MAG: flavodoxin family protein [Spirochaetales bacterium]|nr:flavodoxin family protein [Spirochaetales bacterium]